MRIQYIGIASRAGSAYNVLVDGKLVGRVVRHNREWVATDTAGSWVTTTTLRRDAGTTLARTEKG
jgi:hypothetical protein